MRYGLTVLFLVIGVFIAQSLAANDRQKAEKQVNRISAMAADLTGRRAVNLAMSQQLSVARKDLVSQRREGDVSYGTLFLFRQVAPTDETFKQMVDQLKAGKLPFEIAEASHTDWKAIGNAAKKLNSKIDRDQTSVSMVR